MRLPQDISNLLALCIKNLIWFKDKIISFFAECDVPNSTLLQVKRQKSTPTLKLVPFVLEELYGKGDEGFLIARKMLTKIYYWKDIHSVPAERKDEAISALKELQKAYKTVGVAGTGIASLPRASLLMDSCVHMCSSRHLPSSQIPGDLH